MTGKTGPAMTRESRSLSPIALARSPLSLWGELFNNNNRRRGRKGTLEKFPKTLCWGPDRRSPPPDPPPIPLQIFMDQPAALERPTPAACRCELRRHRRSSHPPGTKLTADLMKHTHWLAARIFSRIKWAEPCRHLCRCGTDLLSVWMGGRLMCVCVCVSVHVRMTTCLCGIKVTGSFYL